jgi:regulator of cell morphogenesis and NO signaling
MLFTAESMVGEIVARDFRTASVFQQFGIDFCCGGRRTLIAACRQQDLDENVVLDAVIRACAVADPGPRFDTWSPEELIGRIVNTHHAYVRRALPVLTAFTQKLAAVHGVRHPELSEVAALTLEVAAEMSTHMMKEEHVLFPYIVAASRAAANGAAAPAAPFGSIDNPIRMMEADHDATGAALARIRELTADYSVPDDGCATYRACLAELRAFEEDLHAHVHLENNILFPAARKLAVPASAY